MLDFKPINLNVDNKDEKRSIRRKDTRQVSHIDFLMISVYADSSICHLHGCINAVLSNCSHSCRLIIATSFKQNYYCEDKHHFVVDWPFYSDLWRNLFCQVGDSIEKHRTWWLNLLTIRLQCRRSWVHGLVIPKWYHLRHRLAFNIMKI